MLCFDIIHGSLQSPAASADTVLEGAKEYGKRGRRDEMEAGKIDVFQLQTLHAAVVGSLVRTEMTKPPFVEPVNLRSLSEEFHIFIKS